MSWPDIKKKFLLYYKFYIVFFIIYSAYLFYNAYLSAYLHYSKSVTITINSIGEANFELLMLAFALPGILWYFINTLKVFADLNDKKEVKNAWFK